MSKNLPYDRTERVADAIYHLISQKMLTDISDPRLDGIHVTKVKMTRDLRIARIYFHMNDASDERKASANKGFKSATGYFRCLIGQELSLKFTPEVEFYYDDAIDAHERIEDLLARIKEDKAHG
ncbi:MAG: 30S ribosome-binding factor RbfA [Pseudomonadota bacterium]